MNPFAVIEEACANVVERAFARVFPSDVVPAQIARKLVATMQSAPADTFLVRLHPRDAARMGAHRAFLESEWAALLAQTAQGMGVTFMHDVRVVMHEDETLVAGTVAIEAADDDDLDAAVAVPPVRREAPPSASEPVAPIGNAVLRIVKGLPLDRAFPIAEAVTIGRSSENVVDVNDARVSRRHARVARDAKGITLEDLGSTNGTTLNGEPIVGLRRLRAGDRIVVGDTELRVDAVQ